MTDKQATNYLPKELRSKYQVKDWPSGSPRCFFQQYAHCGKAYGLVNLEKMNEVYAGNLIRAGFPHLVKRPPVKEAKKKIAFVPKETD